MKTCMNGSFIIRCFYKIDFRFMLDFMIQSNDKNNDCLCWILHKEN